MEEIQRQRYVVLVYWEVVNERTNFTYQMLV